MKFKFHLKGEERTRRKFCWLPLDVNHGNKGVTYWLEWVTVRERFWSEEAYGHGWEVIEVL